MTGPTDTAAHPTVAQRAERAGVLRLAVRRALIDVGMAQKELADRIGMSEAVLSHFLTGRRKQLRPEERDAIARELGSALARAQAEVGRPDVAPESIPGKHQRFVPVYPVGAGYEIAFGDGDTPVGESIEEPIATDVPDPNAFAGKIVGSSMEGEGDTGFREGDLVVFDTKAEVRSGTYCLVRFAEEGSTFKQIYIDGDRVRLHPLNPEFDDETRTRADIAAMYRAVRHVRNI